jgi:hypothetical protein
MACTIGGSTPTWRGAQNTTGYNALQPERRHETPAALAAIGGFMHVATGFVARRAPVRPCNEHAESR